MKRADLIRLWTLANEVKESAAEIVTLRSAAERTTALLTGLPRSCNTTSMREDMTLRLIAAEEKHARLTEELFWRRTEALTAIIEDVSDARCRQILISRYVDCTSWRAISKKMYYSTRQLLRLNEKGLRQLESAADRESANRPSN